VVKAQNTLMKTLNILSIVVIFVFAASQTFGQLYFPPKDNSAWATIAPSDLNWDIQKLGELKDYLEATGTKSFIILKDGKIAVEYYLNDHNQDKPWYWASAGKSLTSCLIGCAEADGLLNLDAASSKYLGDGWSSMTAAQEKNVKVKNHISMTTGLDDDLSFECTDPQCLKYKAEPGTRWSYHNAPYTLCDGIIEGATGKTLNQYFTTRLGSKIGMTGLFIKSDYNNIFYSKARDMAKFGLLVLAKGQWDGVDIIKNPSYIKAMSTSSQSINPAYGYLWWLNGKEKFMLPKAQIVFDGALIPTAPLDMFSALGKNDQKVYVLPSQNIVVIRMGDIATDDGNPVPTKFDVALWKKLSEIMKLPSNTIEENPANATIFHRLGSKIMIDQGIDIGRLVVYSAEGKIVHRSFGTNEIETAQLPFGAYFLVAIFKDGKSYKRSFIAGIN
jgi:CubicO group peptidase (beta-lactamase class C family)